MFAFGLLLATGSLLAQPWFAQESSSAARSQLPSQNQSARPTSKPYSGKLSIFDYPDRDKKLQIERVMDILGIKPDASIADIGAGSGWFTVRAARRVGASGIVYAVDINPEATRYIQNRARKEKISNIRTVLGKENDPLLPPDSVDAALLLKTYHEVSAPVELLKNLRRSLRAGARLGIIDRNGTGDDHGVNRDVVLKEASEAGFSLREEYDFVKDDGMDYFLVFQLASPGNAVPAVH